MHILDWAIVGSLLMLLSIVAIFTNRFTHNVADFLAANRCAGRYLISVSQGMAGLGAITIVASFEIYYKAGFTAAWWQLITTVIITLIFLSGWFTYRFRQTQALTLAQFFEMRYSRRFRIFAGLLAWASGIINFGIFPAVGARFFLYFCGLGDSMLIYALTMLILLGFALLFVFMGGQITVIVTDFFQGIFCNIVFIAILLFVLFTFKWTTIMEGLAAAPPDASLIHPFRIQKLESFNIFYYLIVAFCLWYATGAWQGSQGYNCCALNAHEARMGNILGTWRILPQNLFIMLIPICAYTVLHHHAFAVPAEKANAVLVGISDHYLQKQMTTAITMKFIFPIGIMGVMAAVMLAAFIANHGVYLHSWGSIFIQDVVMPFRKKSLDTKEHLKLLRWSIAGVAIFIFCFSLLFRQTEYITMFLMISGTIFIGGAGAVVIGGLYWKRGTTYGAWGALITGAVLSVTGVVLEQIQNIRPFTNPTLKYIGSQSGAVLSFYASAGAIAVYVMVSLIFRPHVFDLNKMLHHDSPDAEKKAISFMTSLRSLLGMGREFTNGDKILYIGTIGWTALLITIFLTGTAYNAWHKVEVSSWSKFWFYYIISILIISIITTVWLTIGGFRDLNRMFALLRSKRRDDSDDGTVTNVHDETEAIPKAKSEQPHKCTAEECETR